MDAYQQHDAAFTCTKGIFEELVPTASSQNHHAALNSAPGSSSALSACLSSAGLHTQAACCACLTSLGHMHEPAAGRVSGLGGCLTCPVAQQGYSRARSRSELQRERPVWPAMSGPCFEVFADVSWQDAPRAQLSSKNAALKSEGQEPYAARLPNGLDLKTAPLCRIGVRRRGLSLSLAQASTVSRSLV